MKYYVASDGTGDFIAVSSANAVAVPGDQILLKRGDTFREFVNAVSGEEGAFVLYGAYGSGAKPKLLGSFQRNNSSCWRDNGGNIWSDDETDGSEILPNPSFDADTSNWSFYAAADATASGARTTTAVEYDTAPAGYKISCTDNSPDITAIQLYTASLNITSGVWYKLTFRAKASESFSLGRVTLIKTIPNYDEYYSSYYGRTPTITTDWATYDVFFLADTTASDARIDFFLGTMPSGATIYIDTLSFQALAEQNKFTNDVGIVVFNAEESCGIKYSTKAELVAQGNFYIDGNKVLFVYSTENPATYYSNIECGTRMTTQSFFALGTYQIVENLDFRYFGANGVAGSSNHHIIIRDCDFSWSGGCYLSGTTRFGNQIQFWNDAHDIVVERCWFYNSYDEAFTNQGSSGSQYNIIYRNNVYVQCWFGMSSSIGTQDNITFINNTCINSSKSWSANQRSTGLGAEDQARAAMFSTIPTTGSVIKNNIFYDDSDESNSILLKFYTDDISKYAVDNNCYWKPKNPMIATATHSFTQEQYRSWLVNQGAGKDLLSINADPKFTETYKLQSDSPCIDKGKDLGVRDDYEGNERYMGAACDIGAYEYQGNADHQYINGEWVAVGAVSRKDYSNPEQTTRSHRMNFP